MEDVFEECDLLVPEFEVDVGVLGREVEVLDDVFGGLEGLLLECFGEHLGGDFDVLLLLDLVEDVDPDDLAELAEVLGTVLGGVALVVVVFDLELRDLDDGLDGVLLLPDFELL